jgi:hypothetical protein
MPETIQSVALRIGVCYARLPAPAPTTAAAAFATPTTAATPPASSFGLRTSFVHVQRASTYLGAIQCSDRFLSVLSACHLDKAEAARASSIPVGHNADPINLTVNFEQLPQFFFRRVEIQVSNKDVLQASASGVSYLIVWRLRQGSRWRLSPSWNRGRSDEQSNAEEV